MMPKNSPSYTSKLMSSTALRWKGVPTLYVWVRCCTCSIGSNVLFPSDYLETAARMASAHASTVRAVRGTSSPSLRSRSSRSTVSGTVSPIDRSRSTTLQTVSGLLHSRTGSIEFLGENLMGVPAHKVVAKGLAQVPEGRRVFLQMTVEENLEMGAYTRSGGDIDADLEKVYAYFPRLMERRRQIAGTLSGGEQQMLAMGRALMSRPKLLMLDEPSMGLAPILVEQIFKIIQTLHEAGTTILLAEQNAQAALSIADRGYVLETGKIVTSGTGTELLASPEIKKAYLGC